MIDLRLVFALVIVLLIGTSDQFGAFLQSEAARYAKVVREAGVKVD